MNAEFSKDNLLFFTEKSDETTLIWTAQVVDYMPIRELLHYLQEIKASAPIQQEQKVKFEKDNKEEMEIGGQRQFSKRSLEEIEAEAKQNMTQAPPSAMALETALQSAAIQSTKRKRQDTTPQTHNVPSHSSSSSILPNTDDMELETPQGEK